MEWLLHWFYSFLLRKNTLMEYRIQTLSYGYNGLKKFGVYLVSYIPDPHSFYRYIGGYGFYKDGFIGPTGISDDLLLYVAVPWLASFFNIPLEKAVDLFLNGLLLMSLFLSLLGLVLYCKNYLIKLLIAIVWFKKFNLLIFNVIDVYSIGLVVSFSLIPLFLYFEDRKNFGLSFKIFLFFSGFLIGFSEYMRSFSSIPVLFLIIWMMMTNKDLFPKKKSILTLFLMAGLLMPVFYFNVLFYQRNTFLKEHLPNFNAADVINHHVLWHQLYIGFGYYPNPYGLEYKDDISQKKAKSVNPESATAMWGAGYDKTLRPVVFDFIREHLAFVVKSYLKKLRECFLMITPMPMAWLGVFLFFASKKIRFRDLGIGLALMLGTLPGVLVVPSSSYVSTFFGMVYILSIMGYLQWLECMVQKIIDYVKRSRNLLKKTFSPLIY